VAYFLVGIVVNDDHTLYVYDRTTIDRYDMDTLLDKDVANHLRKTPSRGQPIQTISPTMLTLVFVNFPCTMLTISQQC